MVVSRNNDVGLEHSRSDTKLLSHLHRELLRVRVTDERLAELYGRADGCSGGRGGSVHLTAPEVGMIATSAILGEMTAVAVGAALSCLLYTSDAADEEDSVDL